MRLYLILRYLRRAKARYPAKEWFCTPMIRVFVYQGIHVPGALIHTWQYHIFALTNITDQCKETLRQPTYTLYLSLQQWRLRMTLKSATHTGHSMIP